MRIKACGKSLETCDNGVGEIESHSTRVPKSHPKTDLNEDHSLQAVRL
ncbi:MAG: hypothetical protein ACK58L_18790 [Planctomycetota bacterium]